MRQEHAGTGERSIRWGVVVLITGVAVLIGIMTWAGIFRGRSSSEDAGNVSYAEETAGKTEAAIEDAFPGLSALSGNAKKLTKDETVYVIMDADSAEKERLVNEWLRNPEELDTIKDWSRLKKIRNTSGKETFEQEGKHLIWHAGGNDIKYSGTTGIDLPVTVEVSYYLNGEYVTADEIAGQSGDVEIHFDYGVNARDRIVSNGSGYELTHPYIMASGALLDTDVFSDIEVTNGRVIDEAGQAVCLGIALPGAQENLALSRDVIDIPESVVIRAHASGFRINGTYTAALTGLLSDLDTGERKVTDRLGELESALGKLSKASTELVKGGRKVSAGANKLEKGTNKLADGTSELKKGSSALSSGISKLTKGSKQLADGTGKVKSGAKKAASGADELSTGLSEISGRSEDLNDGTDLLEESVFENATELLQANLIAAGMPEEEARLFTLSPSTYKLVLDALTEEAPEHAEDFKAAEERLDALEEYIDGVKAYTAAVDQAASGAKSLSSGMDDLLSGAKSVDKGAGNIYGGLTALSDKMPELRKGIKKIDSGASTVEDGADKLASGTDKLADGIAKFDKEGIKKLVDSMDTTEIAETLDRLDSISKASSIKHFVGGAPKKIAGETRIIFKTDAVE